MFGTEGVSQGLDLRLKLYINYDDVKMVIIKSLMKFFRLCDWFPR